MSVAFIVLLERVVLGHIQYRTGPLIGGIFGVIQTVLDRVKLFNKGNIVNNFYSSSFLSLVVLICIITNLLILVICLLATIMLIYQGMLMSGNIYSKIGRYRMFVLSWGYDLILLLLVLVSPNLLLLPMLYYVLSCEVRRTPIDLVERESELVSGYNTEYSGYEFVGYFLGEYIMIMILIVWYLRGSSIMHLVFFLLVIYVRSSYPRMKYGEVLRSI